MAIQTGTGKQAIGLRWLTECTEVRIDRARMARCIMATLTKLRSPVGQEFPVIAPVYRVAGLAILLHRGMFPEERTALFGMAFIA